MNASLVSFSRSIVVIFFLTLGCLLFPAGLSMASQQNAAAQPADAAETDLPSLQSTATQQEDIQAATQQNNRIQRKTDLVNIDASWPVIGISRVDEESAAFVKTLVDSFEKETAEVAKELAAEQAVENSSDDKTEQDGPPAMFPYELSISHEVMHPSVRALSIVWNVWSFTGGAHGQLAIVTNNYDRSSGVPLLLEDLFIDPQLAILQLSKISRQKLSESDSEAENNKGDDTFVDDMLRAGTEPEEDNFSTFALLPDGIRIYFQPYQVAPWAAGPQEADVTLEDLKAAKPKAEYWEKQTPAQ